MRWKNNNNNSNAIGNNKGEIIEWIMDKIFKEMIIRKYEIRIILQNNVIY